MKIEDSEKLDINSISELLGITTRAFNQRVKQGRYSKVSHGVYNLKDILEAEFRYLKASEETGRNRLYSAQAEKEELKAGELSGELGRTADFLQALIEMFGIVARGLDSMSSRLSNDLAGIKDPRIIRQRLDKESETTRRNLNDKIKKLAENWRTRAESAKNIRAAKKEKPK